MVSLDGLSACRLGASRLASECLVWWPNFHSIFLSFPSLFSLCLAPPPGNGNGNVPSPRKRCPLALETCLSETPLDRRKRSPALIPVLHSRKRPSLGNALLDRRKRSPCLNPPETLSLHETAGNAAPKLRNAACLS